MNNKKYKYTESLYNTLEKLTPEQVEQVHKEIDFHMEQYTRLKEQHGGATVAANYGKNTSEIIKDTTDDKGRTTEENISCKKGCAFCCKMEVHITEDEADLLAAVIKDDGLEIDREKLAEQAKLEKDDWSGKTAEQKACVFLGENDECRIYEYRPINCRKLMVISDPILCDTIKFPNGMVHRYLSIQAEIISTAIMTCNKGGSLSKLLNERLKDN